MKKIVLALVLAAVSGAAMAEWVRVGGTDQFTSYADPASIRRSGNLSKIWTLLDFQSIQISQIVPPYLSLRAQKEYDCGEFQSRSLFATFHAGQMAGGIAVRTLDEPGKWIPIPPGTVDEDILEFACGKK